MPKKQVNIRLTKYELQQVAELIEWGLDVNTTGVISKAIDRLHQQELRRRELRERQPAPAGISSSGDE